jgi:hypothetical protein
LPRRGRHDNKYSTEVVIVQDYTPENPKLPKLPKKSVKSKPPQKQVRTRESAAKKMKVNEVQRSFCDLCCLRCYQYTKYGIREVSPSDSSARRCDARWQTTLTPARGLFTVKLVFSSIQDSEVTKTDDGEDAGPTTPKKVRIAEQPSTLQEDIVLASPIQVCSAAHPLGSAQ